MEKEKYMRRCIQLARNGLYTTPPNPMVGAVVVCDGRIIGEGYHIRWGESHAEVNAIRSVQTPELLKRSTLYVSLEPCSHQGRTPPCVDLILEKEIPEIVIGCEDPFTEVAGRGVSKLREAGRTVVVGVLEEECRNLIRRFTTFHTQQRPYIILKWAESADGFIDRMRTAGKPAILSTPLTSMLVHKQRAETTAILVGTRTARLDNPQLTVRNWHGNNPVRVVIDNHLTLPSTLHLLDGSAPTLVFTTQQRANTPNVEYITLQPTGDQLTQMMQALHARKLQSLLIEGGSQLLQSFIDAGLWDEAYVEFAATELLAGVQAPQLIGSIEKRFETHFGVQMAHYIHKRV